MQTNVSEEFTASIYSAEEFPFLKRWPHPFHTEGGDSSPEALVYISYTLNTEAVGFLKYTYTSLLLWRRKHQISDMVVPTSSTAKMEAAGPFKSHTLISSTFNMHVPGGLLLISSTLERESRGFLKTLSPNLSTMKTEATGSSVSLVLIIQTMLHHQRKPHVYT